MRHDESLGERLRRARELARALMDAHGLADWEFRFNRRKRGAGLCLHHRGTIELSLYFVRLNGPDKVRETLLHEIAHALVGPGHGHGPVWPAKAAGLGV